MVRSSRRDFKRVSGLRKGTIWMEMEKEKAETFGRNLRIICPEKGLFVCNAAEGFLYNGPTSFDLYIRHGKDWELGIEIVRLGWIISEYCCFDISNYGEFRG